MKGTKHVTPKTSILVAVVAMSALTAGQACSGGGGSSGTGGANGSGGAQSGGGGGGSGGAGSGGVGGSATGSGGASAGSGGASAGSGGSGAGGFVNTGLNGESGMGTATATTYVGTHTYQIVGEAGLGVPVCEVQFDVNRVGAATAACADCDWTHLVELSSPVVVTNTDGACDANDCVPALDAAGRSALAGTRLQLGSSQKAGHGDQVMLYDDSLMMWIAAGPGHWDAASGDFGYSLESAGGFCNYGH